MLQPRWLQVLFAVLLLLPSASPTYALSKDQSKAPAQASHTLRTSVMGATGAPAGTGSYKSIGTLGQPSPVGICIASGDTLYSGFWKNYMVLRPTDVTIVPDIHVNRLYQNYPNPFNPVTTIEYSVAKQNSVEITIYNVAGQRVKRLERETKPSGRYRVTWDGTSDAGGKVASGVYFYLLRIGTYRAVKKMVLLK
jgi:hypothetical protein